MPTIRASQLSPTALRMASPLRADGDGPAPIAGRATRSDDACRTGPVRICHTDLPAQVAHNLNQPACEPSRIVMPPFALRRGGFGGGESGHQPLQLRWNCQQCPREGFYGSQSGVLPRMSWIMVSPTCRSLCCRIVRSSNQNPWPPARGAIVQPHCLKAAARANSDQLDRSMRSRSAL